MISITITAILVGRALMYERRGFQGRRQFVPAYHAYAIDERTGDILRYSVTRSASRIVFGHDVSDRFGTNGECPPSLPSSPYRAVISLDRRNLFCLRLYETPEPQQHNVVRGQGDTDRTNIMIHRGPGASQGCFMVAGGRKGHPALERWFKTAARETLPISVTVHPYP